MNAAFKTYLQNHTSSKCQHPLLNHNAEFFIQPHRLHHMKTFTDLLANIILSIQILIMMGNNKRYNYEINTTQQLKLQKQMNHYIQKLQV